MAIIERPVGTSTPDGIVRNRQIDPDTIREGPWDGRAFSYIPPVDITVGDQLALHTDFDLEIDPVTYQVLRSRFWNLNQDHSDTIKRVSGSPLIVYMDDFNTSLLTENGDMIVCGPSVQYFTGHGDLGVKWTLENRSGNPGIADGDVFLHNDPYIGTAHQMDTAIYAPVFVAGRLFCWIFSSCHMGDIGGTIPGSFCPEAPDIFFESTPVPPIKLARGGELQEDVAEMFTRKSRTPDMVALQLRSQLAGLRATRARMEEVIGEYGPTVVKGAMRSIIRDCSQAVGRRLLSIPDGEWEEDIYIGSAGPDDRDVHRISTRLHKVGDRMVFSNESSDEQFFAANATFAAWRSALISAGSMTLGFDQLYCPGGVVDHMVFDPTPGTLNVASYPAAVTPLTANIVGVYVASQVFSKMVMAGPPELRQGATATGGVALPGWWVASGLDRRGNFVADLTGDSLNGSIGAFPFRDGVDTGGAWWWPRSTAGNAEEWEAALPIIYLYRREQVDSGGPGRFRGGNGVEIAVTAHKTDGLDVAIISTDPAVNPTVGLGGGYPAHAGNHQMISGEGLVDRLRAKGIPSDFEQLTTRLGTPSRVSPKAFFRLGGDDVFIVEYPAGGGFGDPLERDPDAVAADVRLGRITAGSAGRRFGVDLSDTGEVDEEATTRRREEMLSARLAAADGVRTGEPPGPPGGRTHPVGDGLVAVVGDDVHFACRRCGTDLGPVDENYKSRAARLDIEPHHVDPDMYPKVSDFCDIAMVLRHTLCPSCGLLLAVRLARPDDNETIDAILDPESVRALVGGEDR